MIYSCCEIVTLAVIELYDERGKRLLKREQIKFVITNSDFLGWTTVSYYSVYVFILGNILCIYIRKINIIINFIAGLS